MKSRAARHNELFLPQKIQLSTLKEMRRETKTGANVQGSREALEAIGAQFPTTNRKQDAEMLEDEPDMPEAAVGTLETLEPRGFDRKPFKCLTDTEARILAGKRAEKSHRNRAHSHKPGRKNKKARNRFKWKIGV